MGRASRRNGTPGGRDGGIVRSGGATRASTPTRVFLATLAFGALQCVEETYPGLHAPKFRYGGAAAPEVRRASPSTRVRVRVSFADGGEVRHSIEDLVPRMQVKTRGRVVGRLAHVAVERHPEALRAWLRREIAEQHEDRAPTRIELIRHPTEDPSAAEVLFVALEPRP